MGQCVGQRSTSPDVDETGDRHQPIHTCLLVRHGAVVRTGARMFGTN